MAEIIVPAIWLIMLLAGLPHLSESVYAPSLPDIANALSVPHAMAEYTLTVYLFGFALGTLFWGRVSDYTGRRPSVLLGLVFYMLGCFGCYTSTTITMLMGSRLLQAFGGSVGSVLAQAILRDVFRGRTLSRMYALLGMSVSFFPALGPAVGGVIADLLGWRAIFMLLVLCAILLLAILFVRLPETHPVADKCAASFVGVLRRFVVDPKVLGLGILVASCNGIGFCYFAEGSFCFINVLGFTAGQFGLTFVGVAIAAVLGGMLSRKLLKKYATFEVLSIGVWVAIIVNTLFSLLIILHYVGIPFNVYVLMAIFMFGQMANVFSKSLITGNALSLALRSYQGCTGTASSLFGFYYYCLTSLITLGMGMLHNHTLLPMPLYFLAISLGMLFVTYIVRIKL